MGQGSKHKQNRGTSQGSDVGSTIKARRVKEGPEDTPASHSVTRVLSSPFGTILFAATTLMAGGFAYFSQQSAAVARAELEHSQATTLLLSQHLDQVYKAYTKVVELEPELSSSDQETLAIWELFDQQFIDLAVNSVESQFETAYVRRRLGFVQLLLGKASEAQLNLQAAKEQFMALLDDFPANFSYRIELARVELISANLSSMQGNAAEASAACQRAFAILELNTSADSEERDEAMDLVLGELTQMSLTLGNWPMAERAARARIAGLDRTLKISPDNPELLSLRAEAEAALQAAMKK